MKKACKDIIMPMMRYAMCQWLQRRDRNFYWVGMHALVQKCKKTVHKHGD
jgi:hypothetical protein